MEIDIPTLTAIFGGLGTAVGVGFAAYFRQKSKINSENHRPSECPVPEVPARIEEKIEHLKNESSEIKTIVQVQDGKVDNLRGTVIGIGTKLDVWMDQNKK